MSLERLAGPFPHTALTPDDEFPSMQTTDEKIWIDPVGLIHCHSSGTRVMQMDGSSHYQGLYRWNGYGLRLIGGSAAHPAGGQRWYCIRNTFTGSDGQADEYELDPITFVRGAHVTDKAPQDTFGSYAHLADRFIRANGAVVAYRPGLEDDETWTTEATIAGMTSARWLSWADEPDCIWVTGTTGRLFKYNFVSKEAVSPIHRIDLEAVRAFFYSRKHKVFVVSANDSGTPSMYVYATTPAPAALSAPAAVSTAPAPGRTVQVRTRVTGSFGEVCVGEPVAWSTTVGEVSPEVSETDDEGYAATGLRIPLAQAAGSVDVTAEVVTP